MLSRTQIDRLGDRLKSGEATREDLRRLSEFRNSFDSAFQEVKQTIECRFKLSPTGRPEKSTKSIVDKMLRESIRLSQMQDIAGCRLIVANCHVQEVLLGRLQRLFPNVAVFDRRKTPSHGYRAVHIIPQVDNKPVEIQLRTLLQHLWAELSEKWADTLDPLIKYGGGSEAVRRDLCALSDEIRDIEAEELKIQELALKIDTELSRTLAEEYDDRYLQQKDVSSAFDAIPELREMQATFSSLRQEHGQRRQSMARTLRDAINQAESRGD